MYRNNSNDAKVGAILNWMGDSAFKVYINFVWDFPADKSNPGKVLTQFENYFKPAQNVYHCWYMLRGVYFSQFKSQSDFMIRLCDIVKDCQFKKPDEIVKFLFLTHNQNPKAREELLKSMKEGDGLNNILGYACLVEGNQHSEHLSKVYLDGVKPSNKTVEAVDKKANKKFQGGSKSQQNSRSKFRSQSRDNKKGCHNCGSKHKPKHCPAFGKECYHCKKKNHSSNMRRSRQHSQSNGQRSQSQNSRFSCKDHHELESSKTYDDSKWYSYKQEFVHIQFTSKHLYHTKPMNVMF